MMSCGSSARQAQRNSVPREGDARAAEPDRHTERHQQEQHGRIAGIVNRRAKADDAGRAGDAERAWQRIADQHYRQRAGHAEEHLRLLHRVVERRALAGVTLHEGHEHADEPGPYEPEDLGHEPRPFAAPDGGRPKHVAHGRQCGHCSSQRLGTEEDDRQHAGDADPNERRVRG